MAKGLSIQEWFGGRGPAREAFLEREGWRGASIAPVGEDSAFRRYFRLSKNGRTAVLMEAVPDGDKNATPGHRIGDFIRIGVYLRNAALHTPEIYAADEAEGYLLLEDFGDVSFRKALGGGVAAADLYGLATDVLIHIRSMSGAIALPEYYSSHVHAGRRRVVDWYMPALTGARNADGMAEEYLTVWDRIEKTLPPCPQGFLHIDYHVENLMWLPGGKKLQRCGILDFQGAMRGPLPYDLANLLEDARADVDAGLRREMLERYCAGMKKEEKEIFKNWYRVLATQFHCRVAGQFIRLAVRDGKMRYLQHLPRLAAYIREGLMHPALAPLRQWFDEQDIDFSKAPAVDPARIKPLIRDDAF